MEEVTHTAILMHFLYFCDAMKVQTGLDIISRGMPSYLEGKRLGILCHAASINSDFSTIIDVFSDNPGCVIGAVFGPQHGLFGQTQDNMIEWEGSGNKSSGIPVYSLYGQHRKPTPSMLKGIEAFVVDLQDVGARLYTYIWTVKLCMEACSEAGIPVYILDRPNPIAAIQADGPVLKKKYFTFVGGAEIPLCHRMTIGEMALWIKTFYVTSCELHVIAMKGWNRRMMFRDTGLPWVLPSPNMPTQETAVVYPGTVLFEAMNISEARGTVIPFELFGAPFLNGPAIINELKLKNPSGCAFRQHDFIPTFHKFSGEYCHGIQIHVTDPATYKPVETMLDILSVIWNTSPAGSARFNPPPYEYEYNLMPFDILSGDSRMREVIENNLPVKDEKDRWKEEISGFLVKFRELSLYSEV
jgi:uncharacterized protein YbbC (DUF1343 family)